MDSMTDQGYTGLDGSFIPPGTLPDLGTIFNPEIGWGRHIADSWRTTWQVTTRRIEDPLDVAPVAEARTHAKAVDLFQEARLSSCAPGQVVEIYQWVLGGWMLHDRAPWMRRENLTSEKPYKEFVRAANGDIVAVVWPERTGSWVRMVAVDGKPDTYISPSTFKESVFRTRLEAIAASLDGEVRERHWAQEWGRHIGGLANAGIGTTVNVTIDFLGPTGRFCSIPDCENEATTLVTRTGEDVGIESWMSCPHHGGEAIARQQFGQ
jgi:hypothetical protein